MHSAANHPHGRGPSAALEAHRGPARGAFRAISEARRGRVLTGKAETRIVLRSTQGERASSVPVRQS
jgi:hypothetical protein